MAANIADLILSEFASTEEFDNFYSEWQREINFCFQTVVQDSLESAVSYLYSICRTEQEQSRLVLTVAISLVMGGKNDLAINFISKAKANSDFAAIVEFSQFLVNKKVIRQIVKTS